MKINYKKGEKNQRELEKEEEKKKLTLETPSYTWHILEACFAAYLFLHLTWSKQSSQHLGHCSSN